MRKSLKKNRWMIVPLLLAVTAAFVPEAVSGAGGGNEVNFSVTDTPGRWFDTGENSVWDVTQ